MLRPSNDENAVREDYSDAMDVDMGTNAGSMASISKCRSTLELHTPKEKFSAVPYLVKMVGMYQGQDDGGGVGNDVEMQDEDNEDDQGQGKEREIRNAVFADIPVSRAQCEQAWVDLCVFVLGHQRRQSGSGLNVAASCRRPSAECAVSSVWKRVMEAAVLQGINLEKQFLVDDLWRSMLDDNGDEPFPRSLFEAVIRRVCELDASHLLSELKCKLFFFFFCLLW